MQFAALVARFAQAAAAGDGDRLAELFTDDGVYDDYFYGPYQGRRRIREMLAHFGEGGRDFTWSFHDPVSDGRVGYASYRFSFTSKAPEADGARVMFEGIGRFELSGGRIARYSEVFDRGAALAQQGFEAARLLKICRRYAEQLKSRPEWTAHQRG
jgi:ketosteroid isomerase-like protein